MFWQKKEEAVMTRVPEERNELVVGSPLRVVIGEQNPHGSVDGVSP